MAFARPVFRRLRTACSALPETEEVSAWGHPVFRVHRKAFLAFELVQERPSVAFRLARQSVDALVSTGAFFPTPYGRGLWASAWADGPSNASHLKRLTLEAYREVAGVRLNAMLAERLGTATTTAPPRVPRRRTRRST